MTNTNINSTYYLGKYTYVTVTVLNKGLIDQYDYLTIAHTNATEYADKIWNKLSEMGDYEKSEAFQALTDEAADEWYDEYNSVYDRYHAADSKAFSLDKARDAVKEAILALEEYETLCDTNM